MKGIIVGKIRYVIGKRQLTHATFDKWKHKLRNGCYYLCYIEGKMGWRRFDSLNGSRYSTEIIRRLVLYGIYRNDSGVMGAAGEILMVSSQGNVKVVNFQGGAASSVVTFFRRKGAYNRVKSFSQSELSDYFHDTVIGLDDKESASEERWIKKASAWYMHEECELETGKWIFRQFQKYLKDVKKNTLVEQYTVEDIVNDVKLSGQEEEAISLLSKIKKRIATYLYVPIPFVYSHNDLHFENILKENNKKYHVIDFEYSSENAFFFDPISWFMREAAYKNRYAYFEKFMDGEFDDELSALSKLVNFEFKNLSRLFYGYMYILLRMRIYEENCLVLGSDEIKLLDGFYDYLGRYEGKTVQYP